MKFRFIIVIFFITIISLYSCKDNYSSLVDNQAIIGSWHLKDIIDQGNIVAPNDSTVYIFINDGQMLVHHFNSVSGSLPDENYHFQFLEGILTYWNFDINVNEEKEVYFFGSIMRIKMYENYYYELEKLY